MQNKTVCVHFSLGQVMLSRFTARMEKQKHEHMHWIHDSEPYVQHLYGVSHIQATL